MDAATKAIHLFLGLAMLPGNERVSLLAQRAKGGSPRAHRIWPAIFGAFFTLSALLS